MLIENARRELDSSLLGRKLADLAQEWRVVEAESASDEILWRA